MNDHYQTPDPWGYKSNLHDIHRRDRILEVLEDFAPFCKALDIGCGEGWITKELPSRTTVGFDISEVALQRVPNSIRKTCSPAEIIGQFDLVTATGVLYRHYEPAPLLRLIKRVASHIILTCHITRIEIRDINIIGKQIYEETFPYRNSTETLRVFKVNSNERSTLHTT